MNSGSHHALLLYMNYFLNIGSNLGNRRLNISRAAQRIMGRYGWMELSHIVESEPWGYESANAFMNIGVRLVSDLEPMQMLIGLQEIERELGGAPTATQTAVTWTVWWTLTSWPWMRCR